MLGFWKGVFPTLIMVSLFVFHQAVHIVNKSALPWISSP